MIRVSLSQSIDIKVNIVHVIQMREKKEKKMRELLMDLYSIAINFIECEVLRLPVSCHTQASRSVAVVVLFRVDDTMNL